MYGASEPPTGHQRIPVAQVGKAPVEPASKRCWLACMEHQSRPPDTNGYPSPKSEKLQSSRHRKDAGSHVWSIRAAHRTPTDTRRPSRKSSSRAGIEKMLARMYAASEPPTGHQRIPVAQVGKAPVEPASKRCWLACTQHQSRPPDTNGYPSPKSEKL